MTIRKAKFSVILRGEVHTIPKWIDSENKPFETADDAREWGDELLAQKGEDTFTITGINGYEELRSWIPVEGGVEEGYSVILSEGQTND